MPLYVLTLRHIHTKVAVVYTYLLCASSYDQFTSCLSLIFMKLFSIMLRLTFIDQFYSQMLSHLLPAILYLLSYHSLLHHLCVYFYTHLLILCALLPYTTLSSRTQLCHSILNYFLFFTIPAHPANPANLADPTYPANPANLADPA